MLLVVVILSVLVLPTATLIWKLTRREAPIRSRRDWGPRDELRR